TRASTSGRRDRPSAPTAACRQIRANRWPVPHNAMTMTARESMQVYVILAFIAAGFAFHFAFNDGLQTESSSPAAAAAPTVSKKLERARELQQTAVRLNKQ